MAENCLLLRQNPEVQTCPLQEVFKSDYSECSNLKQVLGKCYVMFVKDFFKQKPEVRYFITCHDGVTPLYRNYLLHLVQMLFNCIMETCTVAVLVCFFLV